MDKTRHESENDNKCYPVLVTKATVYPARDNPLAQGIDDDDDAYEHIRKKMLARKPFM